MIELNNKRFDTDHIWCAIPVYNNKDTIEHVVEECRKYLRNVVVVDDGSTDINIRSVFSGRDITVLQHNRNLGKGSAIRTALRYVNEQGGNYMITLDGDGQHYPKDIEKFIPLLQGEDNTIVIGCRKFSGMHVPTRSRSGRNIANFWMRVETGVTIDDCQSGFRAYPVRYLSKIPLSGSRYELETEVLARAVWAGLGLKTVTVDVHYPETQSRISHFNLIADNVRIALMHTRLVGRRLAPFPHKRLVRTPNVINYSEILRHPIKEIKVLLRENATPAGLAAAAGVGIFLAVLPILSFHMVVIAYVATRLHLNKVMALGIQNLCMPPLVPIICIELGHYMRYGRWLTEASLHVVFGQLHERVFEWLLGSIIVAPLFAIIAGVIVYFIAQAVQEKATS